MRVAQALTVKEIAHAYEIPEGTVRWLAHRDGWGRTNDGKKPVMYRRADVAKTIEAREEECNLTR